MPINDQDHNLCAAIRENKYYSVEEHLLSGANPNLALNYLLPRFEPKTNKVQLESPSNIDLLTLALHHGAKIEKLDANGKRVMRLSSLYPTLASILTAHKIAQAVEKEIVDELEAEALRLSNNNLADPRIALIYEATNEIKQQVKFIKEQAKTLKLGQVSNAGKTISARLQTLHDNSAFKKYSTSQQWMRRLINVAVTIFFPIGLARLASHRPFWLSPKGRSAHAIENAKRSTNKLLPSLR